jgi:hypothetical protein
VNEADRKPFSKLMATLAEVFGEISTLKIQAYWMALLPYPLAAIEEAAMVLVRSRQTSVTDAGQTFRAPWPTPGDVIAVMQGEAEVREQRRQHRKAFPLAPPDPAVQARVRQLIRDTVERLSEDRCPPEGTPAHKHAHAFMARGLSPDAAWRQAREMCADPQHREGCAICRSETQDGRPSA